MAKKGTINIDIKEEAVAAEEVEAVMAQYDKESNTRKFEGIPSYIIKGLLIAFALYVVSMTLFFTPPEQVRRASFLGLLIALGFLMYPVRKADTAKINYIPWYDYLLSAAGLISFFYYVINFEVIVNRATNILPIDIVFGIIGMLVLVELCRRVVGIPVLVIAGGFVVYAFASGYSLRRIIHQLFYTTEGIIGTPIGVCATFIVLFIILASFLEKSGIANFFIDLANSIAGFASGGPAKVAVISSALEGMYSGSSVANTVGSGSVTIPVMKKTGYKPEFAAAVEAAASTGGQIMPPIMGAAAFLMAEMTGLSYPTIAVAAILPAVLYFAGIFLMIHFEAKKLGLKGLPKESIPKFGKLVLKSGYLFLPIVVLVVLMTRFTASTAAIYAILTAIAVSMFKKETRLTPVKFADALAGGTKNTLGVAIACAVAGVIVGIVTLTGLGQVLINVIVSVSQNNLFFALVLTMISCIILGMGIPTTANYVIMATITAPILVKMGVGLLPAHMFVFYFGIIADITPPVALAAYAGSAIAKSDPLKTGLTATRLAITAFIVPYIFVLNPAMLLIDASIAEIILIVVTSLVGIFGLSAAMEGYMFSHMNVVERIIAVAGGLLLIYPGITTDVVGLILIGLAFVLQYTKGKIVSATDVATKSNKSKKDLLAKLSYEIKNPINTILAITELTKNNKKEVSEEDLELIGSIATRLLGEINDVLEMSEMESGKFEINESTVYLNELLDSIKSSTKFAFKDRHQTFNIVVDEKIAPAFISDMDRLSLAVENLLSNASKFTAQGKEITFKLSLDKESRDEMTLLFEVIDTGIGMSEEKANTILHEADFDGETGLGITIVKNIVEAMDGDIWVNSVLKEGTTFSFTVPVKKTQSLIEDVLEIDNIFNGKKILLVDDKNIDRQIIKTLLDSTKAVVDEAENGQEALSILEKDIDKYDLILMDIQMPYMDGYSATEAIRNLSNPKGKKIPIIAIPVNVVKGSIEKYKNAGMNDYISKPINQKPLIRLLKNYL